MKSAHQIWKESKEQNLTDTQFKQKLVEEGVIVKKDLSYVHRRINIRSHWNTNDNRAKDGIYCSTMQSFNKECSQVYYYNIHHFTKKILFISKF